MDRLTDSDTGKTVVDAEGKKLGIIADVEGDRAYVDPDPSVAEQIMSKLGWGGGDEEDYVVTEDMIDRVDDDVVLTGDL
jgi:sporulation protein YlmC with PRC-barrel domain